MARGPTKANQSPLKYPRDMYVKALLSAQFHRYVHSVSDNRKVFTSSQSAQDFGGRRTPAYTDCFAILDKVRRCGANALLFRCKMPHLLAKRGVI